MKPLARIRSISHPQADASGSNVSSFSSASAIKELDREEGIARGLVEHQLGQRPYLLALGAKGIGDEPLDIAESEWREHDFLDVSTGAAHRLQRPHQRMRGTDLVVAIGADQQEMLHVRFGDQSLEQIKGRRVQPLQIVEEQGKRVLRARKHAEEPPEHHLEAVLRVLRRKFGDRRLFADDGSELRDQVDHELAVRPERLQQRVAPAVQLCVVPAKDPTNEALESLGQRCVRDVAFVLIELAGRKEAARRDQHLVQFVDDRGFADAGIAGHQHEFGSAVGHHAIERRDERVYLALAPVEPFRDQQPVRHVVRTGLELVDAAVRLP